MLLRSYYDRELADYSDTGLVFYQAASSYPVTALTPWQEIQLRGAALFHIAVAANNNQTLIKTHHSFGEFEGIHLFPQAYTRRVIYVVRDPRDLVASVAHHFKFSHEEAVEFMAKPARLNDEFLMTHLLNTWSEHVHSWTTQQRVSVCKVRYEDLHADTASELRQMVEFLDWELNEDRITRAVEANRFEKLRADEREHGFKEAKPHGAFFRRGEVGAWRDELEPELVRQIEQDHREVMIAQGYQPELTEAVA